MLNRCLSIAKKLAVINIIQKYRAFVRPSVKSRHSIQSCYYNLNPKARWPSVIF